MIARPRLTFYTLFALFLVAAATNATTTWPSFRGPQYSGAVPDAQLFDGDAGGLEIGWKRDLGSGYSMVAVDSKRLVTAFQAADKDVIAAFDLEHGDEIWRYEIGEAYAGHSGSHDGPIATPLLVEDRVYGLGPRGDLFAVDAGNGKPIWSLNLVEDLEAEAPYYGFSTSPIMAEGVLVVEIGAGEGRSFGGLDPATGELLWATGTDSIRYQSPVIASIGGEQQVIVVGNKTLSAIDPASGELIWTYEHNGDERDMGGNTIVPVPAGDGRILLMNSHPTSVMLQIEKGEPYAVSELWSAGSIKSSYVQPVYHDGYLYGMNSKIFTCVDAATGETVWRSREAGDGFPTIVGDHVVIMNKPGTLKVAKASSEGYQEVARLEVFEEHSWSAPAFANGSLYLRSMGQLARIDVISGGTDSAEAEAWVAGTAFGAFLADLEAADNKAAVIDAYLGSRESFPIIEPSGAVHFVYRGEANDVGIVGDMIGFRREDPMIPVAGTDLFHYSTRLEPNAAVAYGFKVDFAEEPIPDPLNDATSEGLFGEVSWFAMPAWSEPDFVAEAEPSRQGSVEEVEWTSQAKEGETRKAVVYLPAGYSDATDRRYPTLYFFDGGGALEEGEAKNTLDNLIASRIEPLVAVFVLANEEAGRGDMRPTEKYLEMIVQELVPMIDERYRTIQEPAARAVAGVAGAGDAALAGAFMHSELFGRVGSLWPIVFGLEIAQGMPKADEKSFVMYHAWGTYHLRSPHEAWDQVADNRAFHKMLREAGHRPAGGEVPEGFGWPFFSRYTGDMLVALFPMR